MGISLQPCRSCLTLILSLTLVASSVAHAAPPVPSKEEAAKAHYQKGAQFYRDADYAGAWLEFTSAYQIVPKTELLFNMARCEVKLGRPKEALAHFQQYIAARPDDPDAAGIRKEIGDLQAEVNRLEQREAERPKEVTPEPVRPKPAPERSRPFPVYGTIAAGGTVVLAVVSIALLGSINPQYEYLKSGCGVVGLCDESAVAPLRGQAAAGYAFLGLTVAGAATTAALLSWELRRPVKDKSAGRPVLGAGLGLGWRY